MRYEEYREVVAQLNDPEDVVRLSSQYDERMLDTLYTQKTNRDVKKRFYSVKNRSKQMLRDWKRGKSIVEIAKRNRFPPVMTAMFIFMEDGTSKKDFWAYIRDPSLLESEETAEEVREALRQDIVYSPEANERQRLRGIWGENLLHEWLDGQGVTYRTENEQRTDEEHTKTPDCLLDKPVVYDGHVIYWVESKASFGDNTEFRFNCRKQLIPYTELFGPGLVVYWVGCLDDLECPESIYVCDFSVTEKKLSPIDSLS